MARLATQTKMGFHPSSTISTKKVIDKIINFPENKTVYSLDCCCGEGELIEFIGKEYSCKTFANELDENRAKKASKRNITKILNEDALNGIWKSNGWVGLNFLNPPYDISANGTRLEYDFVERWGQTTAIGGVLLLVVNTSSATVDMAKKLRYQGYKPIASFYDINNEDYKNYGQFFIVLQRQLPNFRTNIEKFMSVFENPINVDEDIEFEKINIKTGVEPSIFKELKIPRWKIEEKLETSLLKNQFFNEFRNVKLLNSSIEHPNEGQAAILIASGALNKKMTLSNGDEVILKGTSKKFKKEIIKPGQTENESDKVRLVDNYQTVVYGLNLTHGQFVEYK